ncbi:MAG TPA: hypothetical protein VIJ16_01970 [Gemmatimonadaceae bacterium]
MHTAPVARPLWHTAVLALITPLLEKHAIKALSLDTPVVFSMGCAIVLAFAVALLHLGGAYAEEPSKFDDHWRDD